MAEPASKSPVTAPRAAPQPVPFKYPAEEEGYVRRLGSALLAHWSELPEELRTAIQAEAVKVWDREYHIPQLAKKIEAFIKHHAKKPPPSSP